MKEKGPRRKTLEEQVKEQYGGKSVFEAAIYNYKSMLSYRSFSLVNFLASIFYDPFKAVDNALMLKRSGFLDEVSAE